MKRIIIVGYEYATSSAWQRVFDHWQEIFAVILNPGNGPGQRFDVEYLRLADKLRQVGIKILGYIHTGVNQANYGTRPFEELRRDAASWKLWYGINGTLDGFFFDEAASDASKLAYYQSARTLISPGGIMVLNHGTIPDPRYADIGDILCTSETSQLKYFGIQFPQWMKDKPASKFYHIIYGAQDPSLLALVDANHAQYFYFTSLPGPNPSYDVEHTVFPKQAAPAQEPSPAALLRTCTNDELTAEVRRRLP
jgi:hypothetical protein